MQHEEESNKPKLPVIVTGKRSLRTALTPWTSALQDMEETKREAAQVVELLDLRQGGLTQTLDGSFPELRNSVWQSEISVQSAVQVSSCYRSPVSLEGLSRLGDCNFVIVHCPHVNLPNSWSVLRAAQIQEMQELCLPLPNVLHMLLPSLLASASQSLLWLSWGSLQCIFPVIGCVH